MRGRGQREAERRTQRQKGDRHKEMKREAWREAGTGTARRLRSFWDQSFRR